MSCNSVEIVTKLNVESQNRLLRIFAKVDIATKLEIIQHQKQLFHKLKSDYIDVDNTVLTLCSLVLSVNQVCNYFGIVKIKAINLTSAQNRPKAKREKLLFYWAIIRTLKLEQNMSLRNISIYLKKYHKLSVAHSTISTIWNELESKNKK